MAAEGYPGEVRKGDLIEGLEAVTNAYVFQAGTAETKEGLVTDGGRVMAVSGFGKDVEQAMLNTYRSVVLIDYEGRTVRTDIGRDLVKVTATKQATPAPQA
jgi:phosphoribosylamine--glycine ligase